MTDPQSPAPAPGETFTWHPAYGGRSTDEVRRELADEIARDQRAYQLALEGAEQSEHASLSSVMEIEKRWSVYSFDWADTEPMALAGRIVAFELERDRRQELFPYAEYRERSARQDRPAQGGLRASMSDDQRHRVANIGAGIVLAILAIIVVGIVLALL